MQLELNMEEREVLTNVLASALGELREEIYKAEVREFKELLKQRETVLVQLLGRVRAFAPTAT